MLAVLTTAGLGVAVATQNAGAATSCSDVEVVFARGTLELPGLGVVGTPFADAVVKALPGKSVTRFAVDYPADVAQLSAGSGATNMSQHIISMAAQCSNTKFVIGGYSQGATVTDIAIGIKTVLGSGKSIPTELAPRVAAVVVFGNPQRIVGSDIPSSSALYGPKAIDFCAAGDPVCQGGVNGLSHIAYLTNGDIDKGAKFAAGKVLSASGGTAPTSSASQSSSGGLLGLFSRLGNR